MTFTYFKLAPATEPGQACFGRRGTAVNLLAHRRRPKRQGIDGDRWQGAALAAGESGWAPGVARKPSASYILQKDPDGCWYLDQWQEDAAATMRPPGANRQDSAAAPASDDAQLFFIIEIN